MVVSRRALEAILSAQHEPATERGA
jgi:hypothetical protein